MFRGDTFKKTLKVNLSDGTKYEFKNGDVVKCGFVFEEVYNQKKIELKEPTNEVVISYTAEEMATLEPQVYVFEMEVTTPTFTKTYQESVTIERDYIHE